MSCLLQMLRQPLLLVIAAFLESFSYMAFEEVSCNVILEDSHLADQVAVYDEGPSFDAAPDAGDDVVSAHGCEVVDVVEDFFLEALRCVSRRLCLQLRKVRDAKTSAQIFGFSSPESCHDLDA